MCLNKCTKQHLNSFRFFHIIVTCVMAEGIEKFRACLLCEFKLTFSHFK